MFRASSSVMLTLVPFSMTEGRPPVRAMFWSNILKELVRVRKVQVVMAGIILGMMTWNSAWEPLAPSILAASIMSSEIACRPAM